MFGEEQIMKEILFNGPVTAAFEMPYDFGNYADGIYHRVIEEDEAFEFHSFEIYGWGIDNGIKYWLILNSFGDKWGMNGTAKIIRGINHQSIEAYSTACDPVI